MANLRFIVDANLPKSVRTITLAYTFFPVKNPALALKPNRSAKSGVVRSSVRLTQSN